MTVELFLLIVVIALCGIAYWFWRHNEESASIACLQIAFAILALLALDVVLHLPSVFTGKTLIKGLEESLK